MIQQKETLAKTECLLARIKKASLALLVNISSNCIVVDKLIANNTADGSIRVVIPQFFDLEICKVSR